MNEAEKKLIWYFQNMDAEGQETLLKIARAFVATGTFARMPELTEEAVKMMNKLEKDLDSRMDEDF